MEVVEMTSEEGSGNNFLMRTIQFGALVVGLSIAYTSFTEGNFLEGVLLIVSTGISIPLVPIWWRIGESIRQFVMPSLVVTSNASETFFKKIFWLYGPQSITAFWLTLFVIISPGYFFPKTTKVKADPVNVEQSSTTESVAGAQPIIVQPPPLHQLLSQHLKPRQQYQR